MDKKTFSMQVILAVLIAMLLIGCGTSVSTPTLNPIPDTPVPPTVRTTPTLRPLPKSYIEVIYANNDCSYSGPNELPTGELFFVLKDIWADTTWMNVVLLTDGKTYQDLLDVQGRQGRFFPQQSWAVGQHSYGSYDSIGGRVYSFNRTVEGEYAIGIGTRNSLWLCGSLKLLRHRNKLAISHIKEQNASWWLEAACTCSLFL